MSIVQFDLESQSQRQRRSGNVDGSFSEASIPVSLSDLRKLKLKPNPNPRRRGRSLSEDSIGYPNPNLPLSDFLSDSEPLFDYPNPNMLSPLNLPLPLSDFLSASNHPNPNHLSLSDFPKPSPNPRRSQPGRRPGNVDGTYPNPNLLSEALFNHPNPNLLFPKPSPNPNRRRRWRKPNPNPRRWGRLSREDWGKLSPKEKEDWGKLSLTERRELLLLIKKEIKQQRKATKQQKHAELLLIREAEQLFISDASVTPYTREKELEPSPKPEITFPMKELAAQSPPMFMFFPNPSLMPNTTKPTITKQEEDEELLLILEAEAEQASATPYELGPLGPSPKPEITFAMKELAAKRLSHLYGPRAEGIAETMRIINKCEICHSTHHLTFECSYFWEVAGYENIVDESNLQIVSEQHKKPTKQQKDSDLLFIHEAGPMSFSKSNPSLMPNTTKGSKITFTKEELSEITFTKEELSEITFTKEELSAPPTSEMMSSMHASGAELQSRNCIICGGAGHWACDCSYFEEIPPDAKIVDDTHYRIVCKLCNMPFEYGTCLYQCLPPTRRKVVPRSTFCFP